MGAHLMRGENTEDVYHATLPSMPQLNATSLHFNGITNLVTHPSKCFSLLFPV